MNRSTGWIVSSPDGFPGIADAFSGWKLHHCDRFSSVFCHAVFVAPGSAAVTGSRARVPAIQHSPLHQTDIGVLCIRRRSTGLGEGLFTKGFPWANEWEATCILAERGRAFDILVAIRAFRLHRLTSRLPKGLAEIQTRGPPLPYSAKGSAKRSVRLLELGRPLLTAGAEASGFVLGFLL